MAYGDDRQETASDLFTSSIDSNWSNGDGDWGALEFVTGGHVQVTTESLDSTIRRSGETYADDQYSRITAQVQNATDAWLGVVVRMASGTDESAYVGAVEQAATDAYEIREYDSSFGVTSLGGILDPGTEIPHSAGDIATIEAEGTTIRFGSDAGGSDVQKVTATDNTITSGDPGVFLTVGTGDQAQAQITAWSGGDISAVTANPKGPFGMPLMGPFGGPI